MWPFNKPKSSEGTCCSGFVTCDGKHHTFTAWHDIRLQGKAWRKGMTEPLTYQTDAQERTCVICHYKERREVSEDY